MDDSTKELFQCTVVGNDIPEARFNAMTALEVAIGILPAYHWKLVQMEHGIGTRPDPDFKPSEIEGEELAEAPIVPCVMTQAVWIFDPDADGGKGAELFGPETPDGDGVEEPEKVTSN